MTKIKGSNFLITGGAGFIGSHLAEKLLSEKGNVVILDDFSNGSMDNLEEIKKEVKIIKIDVSSPLQKIKRALAGHNFDGIFHLACFPRSLSLKDPFRDMEVNAKGTINILEIAKDKKSKVIFTSNSGIYGDPEYLPIDEKHPNKPSTPYDANKLVSEYYMKIYNQIFNVPIAICRLAAVYGERQRVKPGWKPLIPEFVNKVSKGKSPVICWDGNQTRDFIYVKDVVSGLIRAFLGKTKDEIILGTGIETSVREAYDLVCKYLMKDIKPGKSDKTPGDIRRMQLSYNKAKKVIGFKPEYKIEQGIKNYIDWYKSKK